MRDATLSRTIVRAVHPQAEAECQGRGKWEILAPRPGDSCHVREVLGAGTTADEAWSNAADHIHPHPARQP